MDSRLQFSDYTDIPQRGTFLQRLLWHIVHFVIGVWYVAVGVVRMVESYLISHGWLKKYENLNISKVKYLGIVVESEDARRTFEVIELLMWLRKLGVKQVCLYDVEGVLKRSKDVIMEKLGNASLFGDKRTQPAQEINSEPILRRSPRKSQDVSTSALGSQVVKSNIGAEPMLRKSPRKRGPNDTAELRSIPRK